MRWNGAIQLLHTEVFYAGSLVQRGLGISSMEELLMSTLLLVQPSNHHAQLVLPKEQAVPGPKWVALQLKVDWL